MDCFQPLALPDKKIFNIFCDKCNFSSYEYTFASLYIWRKLSNAMYTIFDDTLIVKKNEELIGDFFMVPYNYNVNNLNNILDFLLHYKNISSNEIYLFGDVEDFFINDLKNYSKYNFEIVDIPTDYEYIYLTKDLINLTGKRYHNKKNLYNHFCKSYNYKILEISNSQIIDDCINLIINWEKTKIINSKELAIEKDIIKDALYNYSALNLKSMALYVNNNLAGFTIGEKYRDTAIIHFEKCDTSYKGVYSFINKTFLETFFKDTIYVNREEDCGNPGLKKSKESYHPITLIKKSLIKISDKKNNQ